MQKKYATCMWIFFGKNMVNTYKLVLSPKKYISWDSQEQTFLD
jgi:hypothetical protein